MAKKTYATAGRTFEIRLSGTPSGEYSAWTVESVSEGGKELQIPGIENITSSDENTAYSKACDRIDRWLQP
ncbi:MAG: hypothetical protein ACRD09_14500, partial [Vicinamibacterales bacterium]